MRPTLTALLLLTNAAAAQAIAADPEQGAALYARACARCHGAEAQGGRKGPAIPPGTTLEALGTAHADKRIGAGLSDADRAAVIEYIDGLTQP
ncbi:c-type cytochrome [Sagittula salina]|uniref:Cytochrome c n=1 Tax=Sagittula salina TaxID=2820268 RepID=A0A940S425_9RHOB|nr:cytochrome c [Sagittula salina]MBP0483425.1 cytochrome c [Sagittula salina]